MIVLTNEENMIPSVWDDKIKNLVIKMKEQCKTDNSCIWEKETPELYTEYIKAVRRRDLARTEYIIHMKNISKA